MSKVSRRRFNEYAGPSQVAAGFSHNDNHKDETVAVIVGIIETRKEGGDPITR
jgi:hypothetical protein